MACSDMSVRCQFDESKRTNLCQTNPKEQSFILKLGSQTKKCFYCLPVRIHGHNSFSFAYNSFRL